MVATDVGGVGFVVEDGVGGYLIGPGDAGTLAERVGRLLADPELAREMGAKGRESVRHRFGKEALLAGITDLYTDLLRSRRPCR